MHVEDFLAQAPHLQVEDIKDLRLTGIYGYPKWPNYFDISRLTACPQLEKVTSLDLSSSTKNAGEENVLLDEDVAMLVACPYLARLTTLRLRNHYLTAATAAALATSPFLGSLVALYMGGTHLQAAGAETLLESSRLQRLTTLDLSGSNNIDYYSSTVRDNPSRPLPS